MKIVAVPELDKISKARDKSQAIGEFISWLSMEEGLYICEYLPDDDNQHDGNYYPTSYPIEVLLAKFFGIDEDKAEKERQLLLGNIRE